MSACVSDALYPESLIAHRTLKPAPIVAVFLVLLLARGVGAATPSLDETYTVSGSDDFAIGSGDIRSNVSYDGTETLHISRRGDVTRLRAKVAYVRQNGGARSHTNGGYVIDVSDSGDTVATADHDPDNLTVLNQPFAARLDPGTLHDLAHLNGALPFDFPSPFTHSTLHGYLRHIGGSRSAGRAAVGVRFEAAGPLHGQLPDRPGLTLAGTITMRGTAFYDAGSAVLLALDTTVTVSGNVSNRSRSDPVKIVYTRTIRAQPRRTRQPARTSHS